MSSLIAMRTRIPISKKLREQTKAKYQGHCAYCGNRPEKIQIDHLKPVCRGGDNHPDNLMPSCAICNSYKHNLSLERFRAEIADSIRKARLYSVNYRFAERYGLIQETTRKSIVFYFERGS